MPRSIALLGTVLSLLIAAPAQAAAPPDLGGVSHFGSSADAFTAVCDAATTSTVSWQDAATLPSYSAWAGSQVTIDGDVVIGPQTGDYKFLPWNVGWPDVQFGAIAKEDAELSFTLDLAGTHVNAVVEPSVHGRGICDTFSGATFGSLTNASGTIREVQLSGKYTATITTPDGETYIDRGDASAGVSQSRATTATSSTTTSHVGLSLYSDGIAPVNLDDTDGDGVANALDNCPSAANAAQGNIDGDGLGDACDPDIDGDSFVNASDNCAGIANPDQANLDGDTSGDACDPDRDGDALANASDNCPDAWNAGQADGDGDGFGDACDADSDADGVANSSDNCPSIANAQQENVDGDGLGDRCDPDIDGDGAANAADNCPAAANPTQADWDADGQGDPCDPDRPAAALMSELIADLDGLGLPSGTGSSLLAKLTGALADHNAMKPTSACNKLGSFEREVAALAGKKIAPALAASLTAAVDEIRSTLTCA